LVLFVFYLVFVILNSRSYVYIKHNNVLNDGNQ
jgi:hypothetical protein